MTKLLGIALFIISSPAFADVALVRLIPAPCVIAATASQIPDPLHIPGYGEVFNAPIGWVSSDGKYKIADVPPFTPPQGQVITGPPSYQIDAGCNVSVTYPTGPTPLNVIQTSTFLSRWTVAEYNALLQARAAAVAGNTGAMSFVRQWDIAMALGAIDLNIPAAQNLKSALVSSGILTQARADAIFQ